MTYSCILLSLISAMYYYVSECSNTTAINNFLPFSASFGYAKTLDKLTLQRRSFHIIKECLVVFHKCSTAYFWDRMRML
jgi:hypothetical protein